MLFKNVTKKIMILGLNEITITLAKRLSKKNDVIILNTDNCSQYKNIDIDVIIEQVDSDLLVTFNKYRMNEMTIFLAITEDNEYNLFAAVLAKDLGVKQTIVMVQEVNYLDIDISLDMIFSPYQIIIDRINTELNDTKFLLNLIPGKVHISKLRITDKDFLTYVKVKNIDLKGGLLIAIKRGKNIFLADRDMQLFSGDILYLLYKNRMINKIIKILRRSKIKNKLFILGGGKLGLSLIKNLQDVFEHIVVIEPDFNQCNYLAEKMEKILVLHGEGTDLQLLKDEGLDINSIFLAVSQNDYHNLLSSYVAQNIGCHKVFTILNHFSYQEIARLLGLVNIISVPDIIAESINNYIMTGTEINNIVFGKDITVAKIIIKESSYINDKKIQQLYLPKGILIGLINRDRNIIIPTQGEKIKKGDILTIFYQHKLRSQLNYIFRDSSK